MIGGVTLYHQYVYFLRSSSGARMGWLVRCFGTNVVEDCWVAYSVSSVGTRLLKSLL